MHKNIFAWTAPGANFPEYISINERDGKIEFTLRSPVEDATCGHTASLNMPRDQLASLIQSLLAIPPIDELLESKPLVVYFKNEQDRQEFIAAIKEVKPDMRSVEL